MLPSAIRPAAGTSSRGGGSRRPGRAPARSDALERAEKRASAVHDRVQQVRDVSKDLFKEWEDELKKYSDRGLRAESERELRQTRKQADTSSRP